MAPIIRLLSAVFGILSAVLSGLIFYGGITGINPSLAVSGSAFFLTLWSLTARGCKHSPYWFTLFAGIILVLVSLTSAAGSAVFLLRDDALAITGLSVLIVSRISATQLWINPRRYYAAGSLITLISIAGISLLLPVGGAASELSYQEGKAALNALLHPGAGTYIENIDGYVEKLLEDEILAEGKGGAALKPVSTFAQAVQPDLPIVRDFAAALAAETPGSYYRSSSYGNPSPGPIGVQQIITIHRYISGEWKYVNDPMFVDRDYYSPAGRTLEAGLAGDCDDFAILTAAAIEAIGGKTRIMGGSCAEGGHAWPEVYIGNRTAWKEALEVVGNAYPGRIIQSLSDSSGDYWLCLDWQLGIYSCGENPEVLYQSEWR